jgi:hypothetical protein
MKKFKYNFSPEQIKIIFNALKDYSSSHRCMSKELRPIRDHLNELEFDGDESQLIQAALDSSYSFPEETDEEIECTRVRLKFYEQWYNQDKSIPKTWRSPKEMIKQDIGFINQSRKKNKLPAITY